MMRLLEEPGLAAQTGRDPFGWTTLVGGQKD